MFLRIISFVMSLFTILTVAVSQFNIKSENKKELSEFLVDGKENSLSVGLQDELRKIIKGL